MWEPVGPLPAAVYWRRRWVAMSAVVAVLVPLVWWAGALVGDNDTSARPTSRAALSAPRSAPPSPAAVPVQQEVAVARTGPTPAAPPSPTTPPMTSTGVSAPGPAAGLQRSGGSGPRAPSGTPPATTSEQLVPDDTPRASPPVPPPARVPPSGPVPCTNEMLGVAAEVERPQHRVDEHPLLRLVVANTSDQPCVRDLDAARQEIVVWSGDGAQRLWSSNDCSNASSVDLRTLVPGQPVVFSVRWAGRTSTPGCAEPRTVVPPGAYRVMTRVDDVISAPTPFLRGP